MFVLGKFVETEGRLVVNKGLKEGRKKRLVVDTVLILGVVKMFQNNSVGHAHL